MNTKTRTVIRVETTTVNGVQSSTRTTVKADDGPTREVAGAEVEAAKRKLREFMIGGTGDVDLFREIYERQGA